jgi:hypothetical protein
MLLIATVGTAGEGEVAWFDFEHCSMCQPFMAQEGLMENMSMEFLKQDQGFVEIVTVSPEYMDAYQAAAGQCQIVADRLAGGEDLPLCGMCQAFGGLMNDGAEPQFLMSKNGSVTLVTSDNSEVVARIHEWTDRTKSEMEKMMAAGEGAE